MFSPASSPTHLSALDKRALSLYAFQCLYILFGPPIAVLLLLLSVSISPPLPTSRLPVRSSIHPTVFLCCLHMVNPAAVTYCLTPGSAAEDQLVWDTLQKVEFKNLLIQNHSCTKGCLLTCVPRKELIRCGDSRGLQRAWVRAPGRTGTCAMQEEEGKSRRWVLAYVSEEEVVWLSAERRKKMIPCVCMHVLQD